MKFDAKHIEPWPDFYRMVSNMRALKVIADGYAFTGAFEATLSDDGLLTLTFADAEPAVYEGPASLA